MIKLQDIILFLKKENSLSLDLEDFFFNIQIHVRYWRFLWFMIAVRYQFMALSFGLQLALYMFTKLMAPVAVLPFWGGVKIHICMCFNTGSFHGGK